jgi:hypothetical protein
MRQTTHIVNKKANITSHQLKDGKNGKKIDNQRPSRRDAEKLLKNLCGDQDQKHKELSLQVEIPHHRGVPTV